MRKINKLLLTAMLLIVGVGTVNAGKYYATLSAEWYCNASWNSGTKTMSWNGVWTPPSGGWGSYYFLNTSLPAGDITAYTKFHATLSDFSDNVDHIWLRIKQGDDNYADVKLFAGENNIDLVALATDNPGVDFTKVTDITLWGAKDALAGESIDAEHPASVVLDNVYLQKPEDVITCTGFGDAVTSLGSITDGTRFVISDDGTKAKFFYTNNENENANVENVPYDSYFYFTLEAYDGGDIDGVYWIKITNENGDGYPRGSDGTSNYYLNAVQGYTNVVISGIKTGWGGDKKDALWYVTYDAEKGFSFQNAYRKDNGGNSWLAIGNNFASDQQYLKLYKSINFEVNSELDADGLDFDKFGIAATDRRCLVAEGGLSYNRTSGILTTDGTAGTLSLEFYEPVDLKYLKSFSVNRSGNDAIIDRVRFYDADDNLINTWNGSKLQNNGLDNNATNAFINNNPVKKLVWESDASKSTDLTLTITNITWQLKTMSCVGAGETVLNTLPWIRISDGTKQTPDWNMHTQTDTYYGNYSGDASHYVDLTSYSELRVYRDNNDPCRAFFINAAGTSTNQVNTGSATWNAEKKYWSFDLSEVEKWDGKVALKCIKANSGVSNLTVNNIVVYATPDANAPKYVLAGSGLQLPETVAALADATATAIDATGVTGITTNSEAGRTLLTSANPNCLFLGTTGNGGLANTQNVITSDVCANLELTDGKPFKAPADFTATAAPTYDRSFAASTTTTVCLPFALTSAEASSLGTFYELSSVDGSTLTFTSVDAPLANKAYLVKTTGTSLTLSETGKSIVATPADLSTTVSSIDFIGTLTSTTLPASDGTTDYYAFNNGSLVKIVTKEATLPPFRAYFKVTNGGDVKAFNLKFEDTETGIDSLSPTPSPVSEGSIFNVAGQRMSKLQKGVNILNGHKVLVK